MKVGPIRIEKEDDYQQWKVSLEVRHLNYYTQWYSSHLYTKQEAIERFMADRLKYHESKSQWSLSEFKRWIDEEDIFEQARTALLFLEVDEME